MSTIQIKQLNSTNDLSVAEQNQLLGGGANELLTGFSNGTYNLVPYKGRDYFFQFVDAGGNTEGYVIFGAGIGSDNDFYIQNGNIEAVEKGFTTSRINVGAVTRI